jgi:hypothetical protein
MKVEDPLQRAELPGSSGSRGETRSLPYRSFILRCWQECVASAEGRPTWRFSLLEVGSVEPRRAFANLQTLLAFLAEQTGAAAGGEDHTPSGEQAVDHPPGALPHTELLHTES